MQQAVAELRKHEHRLLSYISRRRGDPSRSEDILQETLLIVMEQSRKQDIANPLAYAYRVADSLIFSQARRDRREEALGDEDFECELPLADEVLEHKQRAEIFETALRGLSPVRRDIFMRRHLHGQSRQQIADDLQLNLESVKKHLVRAMADLASAVSGAAGEAQNKDGQRHGR
jgi:RNA polymerase sigma factor (sigma-70 family)